MTGFGLGEAPLGNGKLGVEIRAVNHRFLDVRVRVARELTDVAGLFDQLARERLSRGRYEISARIEGVPWSMPALDRERARVAFRSLCELRDEIAPGADVPLSLLAAIPELFASSGDLGADRVSAATRDAFAAAANDLDEMRGREGAILKADFVKRLTRARQLALDVASRAPEVLKAHRKRLHDRAERLRAGVEWDIDAPRLEQEIALFAERCDVSEELTRLESHCAQFLGLLDANDAVGRRLDFLLQEMARETNTIGAKSLDAVLSHAVIDLKAEVERMREQVQNVE
jgi:uncharacterized protein (TIGR00255 family)